MSLGNRLLDNLDNPFYVAGGPGFFGKLGIPLIAGREFTDSDNAAGPKVAIVNEQFVKKILEGRSPMGVRFGSGKADTEIVGVVKDSHYSGVKQEPPSLYYTPWRQSKEAGSFSFYVRTELDPAQVIPQVRRVMSSLDRDLPLEDFRTLDDQVRQNIRSDRVVLDLAAAFAILATLMAMLGLYGVMAHSVERRTREIGVRLALGAGVGRIRRMILRELLVILVAGLAIGVSGASMMARLIESQLFGVKSRDAVVICYAVAALAMAAMLAGYFPARKASRVDPVVARRERSAADS